MPILGATEVSKDGELADWLTQGELVEGHGPQCILLLTGTSFVDRIVTNPGVLNIVPLGLSSLR
ncbi:UNVERIFIED_ORG: acyl CoA:acetate/3-ketoacid CoA transferase beta subunit [Shinella zoogloeoides]|nr:acyl CoA:acetate/3-ketoacid CoA transferase beta subunit [Shinella zoogloeoides]